MPSYYPTGRDGYPRKNPWKGRVMVAGKCYSIGYYESREEAEVMEEEFRGGYVKWRNRVAK